jgi:hypothetical protein
MIKHILQMLQIDDFIGSSEYIDIAKGRNEIPKTLKKILIQEKRKRSWKRKQS